MMCVLPIAGVMGEVAAYFDLDGTLLDASSEKTLTAHMLKKQPWRILITTPAWSLRLLGGLLSGKSFYDAARNRGHFTLAKWQSLEDYSNIIAKSKLANKIPEEAKQRIEWHREQGHRLVLVTATVAPMAEAMAKELAMDTVYGCGPEHREGIMSGSEKGWSVPRRKGKVPIVEKDAEENSHDLSQCWAYGNTMADSWFMRICGNPCAVNAESALLKMANEQGWQKFSWRI